MARRVLGAAALLCIVAAAVLPGVSARGWGRGRGQQSAAQNFPDMSQDHYKVLGLRTDASKADIKKVWTSCVPVLRCCSWRGVVWECGALCVVCVEGEGGSVCVC